MIWKKYKAIILIVIFLSVLALVYFFVIKRLITEIEDKKNKLQQAIAIQEDRTSRLKEIPKTRSDFKMLEEGEKKINPFLEKEKAVELIQEVERLAENAGNKVSIEVASAEAPTKATAKNNTETIISSLPTKNYIQLRIKITGSFFSLLKLLNKLENSKYFSDIISLQISRNQNQKEAVVEAPTTGNPFAQPASAEKNSVGAVAREENNQEVISLINIVFYTRD